MKAPIGPYGLRQDYTCPPVRSGRGTGGPRVPVVHVAASRAISGRVGQLSCRSVQCTTYRTQYPIWLRWPSKIKRTFLPFNVRSLTSSAKYFAQRWKCLLSTPATSSGVVIRITRRRQSATVSMIGDPFSSTVRYFRDYPSTTNKGRRTSPLAKYHGHFCESVYLPTENIAHNSPGVPTGKVQDDTTVARVTQ